MNVHAWQIFSSHCRSFCQIVIYMSRILQLCGSTVTVDDCAPRPHSLTFITEMRRTRTWGDTDRILKVRSRNEWMKGGQEVHTCPSCSSRGNTDRPALLFPWDEDTCAIDRGWRSMRQKTRVNGSVMPSHNNCCRRRRGWHDQLSALNKIPFRPVTDG